MSRYTCVVSALLLLGLGMDKSWAAEPPPNPWEATIKQFEAADAKAFPPLGEILFVGSSTIAWWHALEKDFAPLTTVRRGFGGSQMSDALYFAHRIILPYKPRTLVLYEGANDINAGKTPEQIAGDFRQLAAIVLEKLPQTRIIVIAPRQCPSMAAVRPEVDRLNALLLQETLKDPRLEYLDTSSPLFDSWGQPDPKYFSVDMLHMNEAGYAEYRKMITPRLREKSRAIRALEAGKAQRIMVVIGSDPEKPLPWIAEVWSALDKAFPGLATVTASAAHSLDEVEKQVTAGKPDVLLIECPGAQEAPAEQYRAALTVFVDRLRTQAPPCEVIFTITAPPARNARGARAAYLQAWREVAREKKLTLIDLSDAMAEDAKAAVQAAPAVLDTLYGWAPRASGLQAELDRLRVTVFFPERATRGEKTTVALPVTNPTAQSMTFSGAWKMQQGAFTGKKVPPTTIKPGETKIFRFDIQVSEAEVTAPAFTWSASCGKTTVQGATPLTLVTQGAYLLGEQASADGTKLAIALPRQLHPNLREWAGPADCSAGAVVRREDKGFRVNIEVRDNVLCSGGKNPWDNDSVELYFDMRPENRRGTPVKEPGWFQILIDPGFDADGNVKVHTYAQVPGEITGVTATAGKTVDGYRVEVFIPFAGFTVLHGMPGEVFLFDYAVNDSDTPGKLKCQLRWADGKATHLNPVLWGRLSPRRGSGR